MDLIDTHAHLTFPELSGQLEAVLDRSRAVGVSRWITVCTGPEELDAVMNLASGIDGMYAALGFHPHDAAKMTQADMDRLYDLTGHDEVVAVGETGLDYHYMYSDADSQQRIFRAHLDIAVERNKPVVIHTREAFDDTVRILDEYTGRLKNVVIHCYGGDKAQTRLVLERGWYMSFTGTVTFKKADALREVVKLIPPDRVMVETDCPYISPEPMRKIRPNEPSLMVHTAAKLAEIYGMTLEKFAELVTTTSVDFFSLD